MKKIIQFFSDCVGELRKVVWPTRDDVVESTKIVVISTLAISLALGAFDALVSAGVEVLFR
jgi:preprotein translocase subunit SecE